MKFTTTLLSLCLLAFTFAFTMAPAEPQVDKCDEIHEYPEQLATFAGDIPGLMKYYKKHLSPVLLTCKREQSSTVKSMQLELIITKTGKVQSVSFPDLKAAPECKDKIKAEIMKMQGWNPAKIKGKPVCSKFYWPIYGIKWK